MADDVASRLPADRQNIASGARRNLNTIKDKLRTINPGEDIAAGLRAIDTSGHTPGHLSIELASGNDAVIVLADALTHPTISFAHPEWKPAGDHYDPDRAVATRKALLARLANDRSRVIGYHLSFPGLGRVDHSSTAYRFVPGGEINPLLAIAIPQPGTAFAALHGSAPSTLSPCSLAGTRVRVQRH